MYRSRINGKITLESSTWHAMMSRCYSKSYQAHHPSYIGCTSSENFKNFQYFAEWCNNQVGFGNKGWQLDKDILIKGNKVYSEESCSFVPREINILLTDREASRGNYKIGVSYHNKRKTFVAQMSQFGKTKNLGYYLTEDEANYAYIQAKKIYIKIQADNYKDLIDERVYNSLILLSSEE